MSNPVLENNQLRVEISPSGAELQSILFHQKEKLWQGDARWWPRRSPVLFPVVGRCKNNEVRMDGITYPMGQHGFARDLEFVIIQHSPQTLELKLKAKSYQGKLPLMLDLLIRYTLLDNSLQVEYEVIPLGNTSACYSIGAHPGFVIPGKQLSACRLEWEKGENEPRHLLEAGLFTGETLACLNGQTLPLRKELFDLDAIVFMQTQSKKVELWEKDRLIVGMEWENLPQFGIWTQKGCEEFLCLEPWAGHADYTDSAGNWETKKGAQNLNAGTVGYHRWKVWF